MALRRALAWYLALALGAATPQAAPAQTAAQPAPPQILTLDEERLYSASLYGKALEARALVASQALAAENRKIEAELSAEEAALTTKRPTVTAEAFAVLAEAFDAKVERIRAEQQAKAEKLTQNRDAGRKQFLNAAVPILADLMREAGAYAIVHRNALVLAFDAMDITDRAIAALDAKLGDGSSPAP
jgi:Skp family chaperone for outer membrane proteins